MMTDNNMIFANMLLPPLDLGAKVTRKRKDKVMYELAKLTGHTIANPSDKWYSPERDMEWQLAEIRKYGTVRICKDKDSKHWIATTYGTTSKGTGYHGVDVNTGKFITADKAEKLYHTSRA